MQKAGRDEGFKDEDRLATAGAPHAEFGCRRIRRFHFRCCCPHCQVIIMREGCPGYEILALLRLLLAPSEAGLVQGGGAYCVHGSPSGLGLCWGDACLGRRFIGASSLGG